MIDTIRIILEPEFFIITKPEYFEPSASYMNVYPYSKLSKDGSFTCTQFTPPKEIRKEIGIGIYFPRLKYKRIRIKDGWKAYLKIEFSAPKLLFGNNFKEVINADMQHVCDVLRERMRVMGVQVTNHDILHAQVVGIHFGKNIFISDYADCLTLLKAISSVKMNARLESAKTEYRNDGRIVRFRANNHELCFYDKLKDLHAGIHKAKSRSIEEDNEIQAKMLTVYEGQEVLRMEFRINDMKKYDALAKKILPVYTYPEFGALFNADISKAFCNHFWDIIMDGMYHLAFDSSQIKTVFEYLSQKQKWSESKVMTTIGAFCIAKEFGSTFLREFSHKKYQDVTRISKEVNFGPSYILRVVHKIKQELIKFEPIRDDDWRKLNKESSNPYTRDMDKIIAGMHF